MTDLFPADPRRKSGLFLLDFLSRSLGHYSCMALASSSRPCWSALLVLLTCSNDRCSSSATTPLAQRATAGSRLRFRPLHLAWTASLHLLLVHSLIYRRWSGKSQRSRKANVPNTLSRNGRSRVWSYDDCNGGPQEWDGKGVQVQQDGRDFELVNTILVLACTDINTNTTVKLDELAVVQ